MKQSVPAPLDHTLDLQIPFETKRQAEIAVEALKPDPILKPEDFEVQYIAKESVLQVKFRSIDDRVLRVGVSSVINSIKTVVETLDELSYST